jgi:tetratricopeptide (TPR) repeat protein
MILGQYEKAATETRESIRLEPNQVVSYENLGEIYLALNRFDEARTATEEAQGRKLDDIPLHLNLYALAFFQGNAAAMKQQVDWDIGKPSAEDHMLSLESDTEALSGKLEKAREHPGVESARRSDEKEPPYGKRTGRTRKLFGNAEAAAKCCRNSSSRQKPRAEAQAALAMLWQAMRPTLGHLRMTSGELPAGCQSVWPYYPRR